MKKLIILAHMLLASVFSFADIASGESGTCSWVIDDDGKLTISSLIDYGVLDNWIESPWHAYANTIERVVFENTVYANTCQGMFEDCVNLKHVDLSNLNLNDFDGNMSRMFLNCRNLTCLNLSNLTINETMEGNYMDNIFNGCENLTVLILPGLPYIYYCSNAFSGCDNLLKIYSVNLYPSPISGDFFESIPQKDKCKLIVSSDYVYVYADTYGWNRLTIEELGYGDEVIGTCIWTRDGSVETLMPIVDDEGMLPDWKNTYSYSPFAWNGNSGSTFTVKEIIKANTTRSMFFHTSYANIDIKGLNTDDVTDMSRMFFASSRVKELDLNLLNTSNVTNMEGMFSSMSVIESLDISMFDTHNVTNMESMFSDCDQIQHIDMGGIDTRYVTNMSRMFQRCYHLGMLNITGLNMESVQDFYMMFDDCRELNHIYSSSSVPSPLKVGTFSSLPTKETCTLYVPIGSKEAYAAADGWKELGNIKEVLACGASGTCVWYIDEDGLITFEPFDGIEGELGDWSDIETRSSDEYYYKKERSWLKRTEDEIYLNSIITKALFKGTVHTKCCWGMFESCFNLVEVDLTGLKTTGVELMAGMFFNCNNLKDIQWGDFDTSSAINMRHMFYLCRSLESLDLRHFNTGNVTNMESMFTSCSNLLDLNISTFNTGQVTNMNNMFMFVPAERLNLSNFSTENVTDVSTIFDYCDATTIVSNTTTPNVLKDGTFSSLPNKETCTLIVPEGSVDLYKNATGWKELGIIDSKYRITLADGTPYTNTADTEYDEINYTRTFNNLNWQALYIPFSLNYEDWADDFDLADINNFHQYDDDNDGTYDRTELEVIKKVNGSTVPNTPYLIRAKSIGEHTLTTENTTLCKNEENSIDCSSVSYNYVFQGTYSPVQNMATAGYYAMSSGALKRAEDDSVVLNPYRWYLSIISRSTGDPVLLVKSIRIFDGDDEETAIMEIDDQNETTSVYDLTGRKVENMRNGMYIKNGKKYLVK